MASRSSVQVLCYLYVFLLCAVGLNCADPDVDRNVMEMIEAHGFYGEQYLVKTTDGYYLKLYRVSRGDPNNKRPVLLAHGLLDSAFSWVSNSERDSLAYVLANEGYDVWLANVRGNGESYAHETLTVKDKRFWNFSVDEFALYDIPATIDFILHTTRHRLLSYVGHSQGTSQFFALTSLRPEYLLKIDAFVGLAPVTQMSNVGETLGLKVLARSRFVEVLNYWTSGQFFPRFTKLHASVSLPVAALISRIPGARYLLSGGLKAFEYILGSPFNTINKERLPVLVTHAPAATSFKNLLHWGQLLLTKQFSRYDYGTTENRRIYNQDRPAPHDLKNALANIRVQHPLRMLIAHGGKDFLATTRDVQHLITQLTQAGFREQEDLVTLYHERYGHIDYIWGQECASIVYPEVVRFLANRVPMPEPAALDPGLDVSG